MPALKGRFSLTTNEGSGGPVPLWGMWSAHTPHMLICAYIACHTSSALSFFILNIEGTSDSSKVSKNSVSNGSYCEHRQVGWWQTNSKTAAPISSYPELQSQQEQHTEGGLAPWPLSSTQGDPLLLPLRHPSSSSHAGRPLPSPRLSSCRNP